MRIALYQPDIPGNAGTILRLAACLGLPVDIIGPAGFDHSDRTLRRAGLDYLAHVEIVRHASFSAFEQFRRQLPARLVLLTAHADTRHLDHTFEPTDILMAGRESAGVPADVHAAADARIIVPMCAGLRSLNVAVAVAIAVGEALRQVGGFPSGA